MNTATTDTARDHSSVRGFCLHCRVPWPCRILKQRMELDRWAFTREP